MHRIPQQIPFLIQKSEIHSPGIHTDAVYLPICFGFNQPLLDFMKQAEKIPIHGIPQDDGIVGKTVQLLHGYLFPVKASQHDSSAGSPQVNR